MNKIYFIAAGGMAAAIFFAYIAGGKIARERCRADMAVAAQTVALQNITENNNKQRIINEETYRTGVRDMRVWLREKYTIAD
jgi:pyrroline-5-carboxylate reductase